MAKITLITGKVNSGKTRMLQKRILALKPKGMNSFICVKRLNHQKQIVGYDLIRIRDGQKLNALTVKDRKHAYQDYFQYGPYIFSKDAFYQAERILDQALLDPSVETIVMDEIGEVEIMGLGYAHSLSKALLSDKNLIMTVNEDRLQNVLHHFKIKEEDLTEILRLP